MVFRLQEVTHRDLPLADGDASTCEEALIAVRSEIVSSACPDLDTDCGLLWVQIDLTGAKSLYISALYRPESESESESFFISSTYILMLQTIDVYIIIKIK